MTNEALIQAVRQLKRRSAEADRLIAEVDRLAVDPLANLTKLKKRVATLQTCAAAIEESEPIGADVASFAARHAAQVEDLVRDSRASFGVELEALLKSMGIRLTGQYPDLVAGLFSLELHLEEGEVRIWFGPKQELLGSCPASPAKTVSWLEAAKAKLGSHVDGAAFVAKVRESYGWLRSRQREDRPVPVTGLLPPVAMSLQTKRFAEDPRQELFKSYSRADLAFDLYRYRPALVEAGVHLRVATRAETRNRRDFLWVPDDETGRGSFYSQVSIEGL